MPRQSRKDSVYALFFQFVCSQVFLRRHTQRLIRIKHWETPDPVLCTLLENSFSCCPWSLRGPLNCIISLLHPLDRYRTLSTIGSAIGIPYLALSYIHTGVLHCATVVSQRLKPFKQDRNKNSIEAAILDSQEAAQYQAKGCSRKMPPLSSFCSFQWGCLLEHSFLQHFRLDQSSVMQDKFYIQRFSNTSFGRTLSGVIRANRFAWFARIGWFARVGKFEWFVRIGLTHYKKRGFNCEWFARIDSRESRCESPVPLRSNTSGFQFWGPFARTNFWSALCVLDRDFEFSTAGGH